MSHVIAQSNRRHCHKNNRILVFGEINTICKTNTKEVTEMFFGLQKNNGQNWVECVSMNLKSTGIMKKKIDWKWPTEQGQSRSNSNKCDRFSHFNFNSLCRFCCRCSMWDPFSLVIWQRHSQWFDFNLILRQCNRNPISNSRCKMTRYAFASTRIQNTQASDTHALIQRMDVSNDMIIN